MKLVKLLLNAVVAWALGLVSNDRRPSQNDFHARLGDRYRSMASRKCGESAEHACGLARTDPGPVSTSLGATPLLSQFTRAQFEFSAIASIVRPRMVLELTRGKVRGKEARSHT